MEGVDRGELLHAMSTDQRLYGRTHEHTRAHLEREGRDWRGVISRVGRQHPSNKCFCVVYPAPAPLSLALSLLS